jgi:hypothetical protein
MAALINEPESKTAHIVKIPIIHPFTFTITVQYNRILGYFLHLFSILARRFRG